MPDHYPKRRDEDPDFDPVLHQCGRKHRWHSFFLQCRGGCHEGQEGAGPATQGAGGSVRGGPYCERCQDEFSFLDVARYPYADECDYRDVDDCAGKYGFAGKGSGLSGQDSRLEPAFAESGERDSGYVQDRERQGRSGFRGGFAAAAGGRCTGYVSAACFGKEAGTECECFTRAA